MKVFKFGGASVKDAEGVRNVASIVKSYSGDLIIIISAMGKTTNALEEIVKTISPVKKKSYYRSLKALKNITYPL